MGKVKSAGKATEGRAGADPVISRGDGAARRPLRAAIAQCAPHMIAILIFSFFYNLLFLAPALFMIQVYDRVLSTRGLETLLFLCLVLGGALATLGIMDWVRNRVLARASLRLDEALSPVLIRHVVMGGSGSGAGRQRQALRDFDVFRQGVAGPGTLAIVDLPWTVIFLLVLTAIHWSLGLIALAAAAVLLGLSVLNERLAKSAISQASEDAARAYMMVETSAAGAEAVRGLGLRDALTAKHLAERRAAMHSQANAAFGASTFQSLIKVLRLVVQSGLLAWGALLAVQGWISPGAMFAASILGARALQPIEQLTAAWRSILQARSAHAALRPILETPEAAAVAPLPPPAGSVQVEGLTVARPGGGEPVLRSITFSVAPGEALGVVGRSGSGKTTLARALVGAAPAHAGTVKIDSAHIGQWDSDRLGLSIGYLPQGVQLLPGTIKENIARFAEYRGEPADVVMAKVVDAAKLAGAHEMILSLPRGYETELGAHSGVSGGQAQRIGLARALYGEPSILILDEPNAFLDQEGEVALLKAMNTVRERQGCIIMIAHRAGVLKACDRLLVLTDGRVEMSGPRDHVMARLNGVAPPAGAAPVVISGGRAT